MNAETSVDLRLVLRLADGITTRRLTILRALQNGQPMNAAAIQGRFSVSRATAKRDLAVVRRAVGTVTP